MYQNMSCVIFCYELLKYLVSYKVYNSAGEQIVEPNILYTSNNTNYGIIIPYGGYLEVTMDDSHKINIKPYGVNNSLFTITPNSNVKFRVVRDYIAEVSEVTNVNGVETYTELHP